MPKFTLLFILLLICSCKPVETENIHLSEYEFIPFSLFQKLPYEIRETSGLSLDKASIWTHNDSGNSPVLFQLSENGELQNKVWIKKGSNTDWEDITTDNEFVYIGDFGNNLGTRRNLRIYKLPKVSLSAKEASVTDTIRFLYPEQTEFPGSYNHNFDCEALITYRDSIYLFTKNWKNHACNLYMLPKTSGKYDAVHVGQFNTNGAITGAALNASQNKLALIGYNYSGIMDPFIWLFENFEGSDFFGGTAKRYNLDMQSQAEAIEFLNDSTLVMSSEAGSMGSASLYTISIGTHFNTTK